MKVYFNNILEKVDFEISSNDYNFPKENLWYPSLQVFTRFLYKEDQWIVVPVENLSNINSLVIMQHNITSGANIKFQVNNVDEWETPSIDAIIPWEENNIIYEFGIENSGPGFIRVCIDDPSNTNFIDIGYMAFCESYIYPAGTRVDDSDDETEAEAQYHAGYHFGQDGEDYRLFSVTVPRLLESDRQAIRHFWKSVKNIKPVVFLAWEKQCSIEEPALCFLNQNKNSAKGTGELFPWSLKHLYREVV